MVLDADIRRNIDVWMDKMYWNATFCRLNSVVWKWCHPENPVDYAYAFDYFLWGCNQLVCVRRDLILWIRHNITPSRAQGSQRDFANHRMLHKFEEKSFIHSSRNIYGLYNNTKEAKVNMGNLITHKSEQSKEYHISDANSWYQKKVGVATRARCFLPFLLVKQKHCEDPLSRISWLCTGLLCIAGSKPSLFNPVSCFGLDGQQRINLYCTERLHSNAHTPCRTQTGCGPGTVSSRTFVFFKEGGGVERGVQNWKARVGVLHGTLGTNIVARCIDGSIPVF